MKQEKYFYESDLLKLFIINLTRKRHSLYTGIDSEIFSMYNMGCTKKLSGGSKE